MDASWGVWLGWTAALVLVALGVAGTVLPALPGPVLVLAGLALAAWAEGFTEVGGGTIAVLCGLAALAYAVDFIASALGVRRVGASNQAVIGAALGALVGLFFGLPGLIFGPFIGAVVGEVLARGSFEGAGRVGVATWIGMVVGGAVKMALVISMIGVFAVQRFF